MQLNVYVCTYMLLKQEKPEMDDFEEKFYRKNTSISIF